MFKKFLVLFIALLMSITFAGCRSDHTEPKNEPISEDAQKVLLSETFSSDAFFDEKDGDDSLPDEDIKARIPHIPSDRYEAYPDTQNIPLSATLYKNGEKISIDVNDPRLIRLTNFFNNCVYYSKCAYTQGLLPLDYIEENVTGAAFRLELKYTPYGETAPEPYGTHTTLCDTIIITNSYSGFTLISHNLPGYEGEEDKYPFHAVGYSPLYDTYPWLDLFGF